MTLLRLPLLNMRISALLLFIFSSGFVQAQKLDTLKMMHYNLLYYGEYTSFCTSSNNNVVDKDAHLKTIIGEALPDVFTVNELSSTAIYAERILVNCLNQDGRDYFERANSTGNTVSNLVNMLYYNSDKLVLSEQDQISKSIGGQNLIRIIDRYSLYVNEPFLAQTVDTNWIHVFVAHLAASDASMRLLQTEALMDYLAKNRLSGSIFFAGDLNVKNSGVAEFQELLQNPDTSIRFVDPVNQLGNWYSNSSFKSVHSQSTHTSGGCYSGGGMDDRFDFFLINKSLADSSNRAQYIANTYFTMGQDGQRLNGSLISPNNSSLPSGVITALYEMSDHLPVGLSIEVKVLEPTGFEEEVLGEISFNNPVQDQLRIDVFETNVKEATLVLYSISGAKVVDKKLHFGLGESIYLIELSQLPKGFYIMEISQKGKLLGGGKLVKL